MINFFTYILQENLQIDMILVYSSHSSFHVQRANHYGNCFHVMTSSWLVIFLAARVINLPADPRCMHKPRASFSLLPWSNRTAPDMYHSSEGTVCTQRPYIQAVCLFVPSVGTDPFLRKNKNRSRRGISVPEPSAKHMIQHTEYGLVQWEKGGIYWSFKCNRRHI